MRDAVAVKTLVVGAGVAGLTLAARLSQQGRPPLVVERSPKDEHGYAIGLYPLGSCVLHGLGTYETLRERSEAIRRYEMADESGAILQAFDMSVLTAAAGPMLMLSRSQLLDVLASSCARAEIRRGVMVRTLAQRDDHIEVELDDGTTDRFDVVIACDGMASSTRAWLFAEPARYDSGWTLWTWWDTTGGFDHGVVREWWGAGSFFGAYPAAEACMCAAGGPAAGLREDDARAALRLPLHRLRQRVPVIARAVDDVEDAYPWPMSDVRSSHWVRGRIALCGDSAVGFMPTAGVGASNAMRAAAALADELSRADAGSIPLALELYEQRCRRVVERNQTASRRLARVMFVRSRFFARARDVVARRYPAERALAEIIDSVHQPF